MEVNGFTPTHQQKVMFVGITDKHQVELPNGTIKKLTGRDLIFDDDPVELT